MWKFINQKIERAAYFLAGKDKEYAEIKFWKKELKQYVRWYTGELTELYGHRAPVLKVDAYTIELSAILTFFEVHQKVKYLSDLVLDAEEFKGMKVLDVGSGPFPSALCFKEC